MTDLLELLKHLQQGCQIVCIVEGKEYILELVNIKPAEVG